MNTYFRTVSMMLCHFLACSSSFKSEKEDCQCFSSVIPKTFERENGSTTGIEDVLARVCTHEYVYVCVVYVCM